MSEGAPRSAVALGGWAVPRPVLVKAVVLAVALLAPALGCALALGVDVALGVLLGLGIGLSIAGAGSLAAAVAIVAVNVAALLAGGLAQGSALGAAAVVALAGLAIGPANLRGIGRGLMLAPVLAAVAASGTLGAVVVAPAVGVAIGAAWAAGLLLRLGGSRAPVPLSRSDAWLHAIAMALATSLATLVSLAVPLPHGYWIVVTLAAVLQPVAAETSRATGERVVGTLVGSLLAVALGAVLPSWSVAIAIVVFMTLLIAYALLDDGVRRVAALTVLVVLALSGATGMVGLEVALQRLAWTLVGAVLVAATGLVVARVSESLASPRHGAVHGR